MDGNGISMHRCPFNGFELCKANCMLSVWDKQRGVAYCALVVWSAMNLHGSSLNAIDISSLIKE